MCISYNSGKNKYKNWIVAEGNYIPENTSKFETIFSLGNGYMGLRGSNEEASSGEVRGCYVAGLFDKFPGEVTELPNIPDWTKIEIKLNGEIFNLCKGEILSYKRELNMLDGELVRNIVWLSPSGEKTNLIFRRIVSMSNLNIAVIKIEIRPIDYSLTIEISSGRKSSPMVT